MYLGIFIIENEVDMIRSPKSRPKKGYGILRVNMDICRKINIY